MNHTAVHQMKLFHLPLHLKSDIRNYIFVIPKFLQYSNINKNVCVFIYIYWQKLISNWQDWNWHALFIDWSKPTATRTARNNQDVGVAITGEKKLHNPGYIFFLQCRYLHISNKSPKKAFQIYIYTHTLVNIRIRQYKKWEH